MTEKRKGTPSKGKEKIREKGKNIQTEKLKETKGLKDLKNLATRVAASAQKTKKKNEIIQRIKTSQRKAVNPEFKKDEPKTVNFEVLGSRIAQRAHALYEARNGIHGHDLEDWLEAERQILSEKLTEQGFGNSS